jgi:hypothetical protein
MKRRLLNLQDEKYVLDVTGILNNSVTMAQDNRSSPRSVCGQDHSRYTRAGILNNSVTMAQDNSKYTRAGILNNSVTMAQDNRSSPRSVCGQDHSRYTRAGIRNNSVTMGQDNRTTAGTLEKGSSKTALPWHRTTGPQQVH